MVSTHRHAFMLYGLLGVLAAGLLDAVISAAWDFVAVFSICLVLVVVLLVGFLGRSRRPIGIRPDLARWLEHEAGARGESVERLTDRCIASYQAGLSEIS